MRLLIKLGRVSQILLRVSAVAFLGCVAFVIWPVRAVLMEVRTTVHDAGEVARTTQPLIRPTSRNLNAVLVQAGIAGDSVAQASIEQRKYWSRISAETIDLIGDAQDAMKSVKVAADTANGQIGQLDGVLNSSKTAIDNFSFTLTNRVNPLLASSDELVKSGNVFLSDPHLRSTVANFDAGSHSFSMMADDSQRWLHGTLFPDRKPVSKWRLAWRAIPLSAELAKALAYGRIAAGQ